MIAPEEGFPPGPAILAHVDLPASPACWEILGDGYEPWFSRYLQLLREQAHAHGGGEITSSADATVYRFAGPSTALRFALALQVDLSEEGWPEAIADHLARVAIDAGALNCSTAAGRPVYFGAALHRVESIAACAHAGQIIVTESVLEGAGDALAGSVVTPLGEHRLGGQDAPLALWQLLPPPLASRAFPGLDTGTAPQTNLEAPATSFVGREIDIEALDGFLFGPTAATLVTITGGPGIGKTRLAREFALSRIDRFAGGCWFIDLGEVTDLAGIAHAVSRALGAPLSPRLDPAEAVADILECREPLLLVLDNFEQVVAAAEETIGLWRSRAPHLRCLVTSRVRLHLAGEQSCELTPLSVPPARGDRPVMPDQLSSYDSVRLFVDRARLVRRDFRIEASNAAAIAELCAAVDGLPLAIELATARLSILSPRQIADRLTEKFEILSTTEKGRHPRHQTLLAAIEWSFELLTGAEQQAFLQACTFRGGFSLEAALAVIDLSAIDGAPPAIDVVQSLCEKSLIHSFETPHEMRFGLYLPIREFGGERQRRLLDDGALRALEARHARHQVAYGETWSPRVHSSRCAEALDRLSLEVENLFAAQERALERNDGDTAARAILAAADVLTLRGPFSERAPRLERTLEHLGEGDGELRLRLTGELVAALEATGECDRAAAFADEGIRLAAEGATPAVAARIHLRRAELHRLRGEIEPARRSISDSETLSRRAGDAHGIAVALGGRGSIALSQGHIDEALEPLAEAESLARESDDKPLLVRILNNRANALKMRKRLDEALGCYREAASIAREIGDKRGTALSTGNTGNALFDSHRFHEALKRFIEAETLLRELGDKSGIARNLCNRANALKDLDDLDGAFACYEKSVEIYRSLGERRAVAVILGNRALISVKRGELDAALDSNREAERMLEELGDEHTRLLFVSNRGYIHEQRGELTEALSCYSEAEAAAGELHNRHTMAEEGGKRGRMLLELGRPDEARESVRRSLSIFDEEGTRESAEYFVQLSTLARAELELGNEEEGQELADQALELAQSLDLDSAEATDEVRAGLETVERIRRRGSAAVASPAGPAPTRTFPEGPPVPVPVRAAGITDEDLIGRTLGGCRILEIIGRGGMGAVFKAHQASIDRIVAVKVFSDSAAGDAQRLARIRQEARTVGRFNHAAIVQIHEVGVEIGLHYLIMELVEGGNLRHHVEGGPARRLQVPEGLAFLEEAADGMCEAERLGVIHRDLKPENLLLSKAGHIKISDFGIAKSLGEDLNLTLEGTLLGTPLYMSPEQCTQSPVDHMSDIYSLGATFYHLFTGRRPVEAGSLYELLRRKSEIERLSPREALAGEDFPEEVSRIIERMTARRPEDRYASFRELREKLARMRAGGEP